MSQSNIQAAGSHYFKSKQLPIAVLELEPSPRAQHAHDLTTERHDHDFTELVLIVAGSGRQWIDGVEYEVGVGDCFVIRRHASHRFAERSAGLINIQFDPAGLPWPEEWFRRMPGYEALFGGDIGAGRLTLDRRGLETARQLAVRLRDELAAEAPGCEAAAAGLLWELIVFLSRRREMPDAGRMQPVLDRIQCDYGEDLTLSMLAEEARLSQNQLLRLFKAATGETPMRYLLGVRLRHAGIMLFEEDRPVGEIAFACGFRDSNYFSKKFREAHGCSPRAWRGGRAQSMHLLHEK